MELKLIENCIDYVIVEKDYVQYELQIDDGKFNGTVVVIGEERVIQTRSEKQPIVLAALENGWIEI
jgi:hypothetical protein